MLIPWVIWWQAKTFGCCQVCVLSASWCLCSAKDLLWQKNIHSVQFNYFYAHFVNLFLFFFLNQHYNKKANGMCHINCRNTYMRAYTASKQWVETQHWHSTKQCCCFFNPEFIFSNTSHFLILGHIVDIF